MSLYPRCLLDGFMEWLSPPRCAACDQPLGPGEGLLCGSCEDTLIPLGGHRCPRCGSPCPRGGCRECQLYPPLGRSTRALYAYGGALGQVIRRFKYGGRLDLARPLGILLAPALSSQDLLVVPIPSSPAALAARGFDPMLEILRSMPKGTVRWVPLLRRVDRRPAQAGLSSEARRQLGPEAFRTRSGARLEGERLCLVDDVLTTGATARAGIAALHAAGARWVDVLTLARSEA